MSLVSLPRPSYETPFYWWGYPSQAPSPPTLEALVAGGVLTRSEADFLVTALDDGKSLAVVSDTSGAGKSTFLWALTMSAQRDVSRIFVRGQYEPFAFRSLAEADSPPILLLINEVSPFLPVYCWGRVRDRLFGPEFSHVQKVATAHAASLDAFLGNADSSQNVPLDSAAPAFDVAVFLEPRSSGKSFFRLLDVWSTS